MNFEIRKLGPSEALILDRVAPEVFDEPIDAARLLAYLSEPGHHMFLAIAGREVVGQCAAVIHRHPDKPTEIYIDEIGVTPAFQRRHVASAMLDAMFEFGREMGCSEAWVGTEPGNAPARFFYESRKEKRKPAEDFVMYVYQL